MVNLNFDSGPSQQIKTSANFLIYALTDRQQGQGKKELHI